MNKRKFIIIFFVIIAMILSMLSNCYATSVKVTEENFKASIQKFIEEELEIKDYEIETKNNVMTITIDGRKYELNYNLTGNPTFSYAANITEGMSYAEYENEIDSLSAMPMIGYLAVANIQDIDFKDSETYFSMNLLSYGFSEATSNTNNYMIVSEVSEGTTVTSDTSKVIYESEFSNHVMEYTNSQYGTKKSYNDDGKTFNWTIEQKDKTDSSCKLVSTITVNMDADFSKINGYEEDLTNTLSDMFSEETKNTGNDLIVNVTSQVISSNNTSANNTTSNTNKSIQPIYNNSNNNIYKIIDEIQSKKSHATVKTEGTTETTMPRTGIETNPLLIASYVCFISAAMGIVVLLITSRKRKK